MADKRKKAAIYDFLFPIRSHKLRQRLELDLDYSHHYLCKNFRSFSKPPILLPEAFQIVDSDAHNNSGKSNRSGTSNGERDCETGSALTSASRPTKNDRSPLVCSYPRLKDKAHRHHVKDCALYPNSKKLALTKTRAEEKARKEPSKLTGV